jgi:pilus assembly protein FimV
MSVAALVGGLTFFAGGVILFVYLQRRRNGNAEVEKGIPTISATTPADNAEPEKRTGGARRRQFLSVVHNRRSGPARRRCDHPQSGMENIFAEEVDPLAEADAYLAHGRDEDAEHILKDAIAKDPTRHDLTIKLLDLYRQHRDQEAFYVLAEELHTALGVAGANSGTE